MQETWLSFKQLKLNILFIPDSLRFSWNQSLFPFLFLNNALSLFNTWGDMMEKTYTGRLQWHVTTNSIRLITQYLHFNHKMPGDGSSKKIKNLICNDSNCSSYQLFLDLRQITDLTSLKDSLLAFSELLFLNMYTEEHTFIENLRL